MSCRDLAWTVVWAAMLAAGCGGDGAERFAGELGQAEQTFGSCAVCHRSVATDLIAAGGHAPGLMLPCEICHVDEAPGEVGPAHRRRPACADCHSEQRTHGDPAAGTPGECVVCHTPHGSPNLRLVRTEIETPASGAAPVTFLDRSDGLSDEGYASATVPGRGVCETCHTNTRFFRADGGGEEHFAFQCTLCHAHAAGFARP